MRRLFMLPRAGSRPATPRLAAVRAENTALFLPLVGGKAAPKPPGARGAVAAQTLDDLLAFAIRNQPRASPVASPDPAALAALLASLADQVFSLNDLRRFQRKCAELPPHLRHAPLCALAARVPYLPSPADRRQAIGIVFTDADLLRPPARSLLLAALAPAVLLDPDAPLCEEAARHARMLHGLPAEERSRAERAVAAIRLFTDPNGLERAFLRTPEADRAAFVDYRLRTLIEALPPDHRFEPISALVELRRHIRRADVGLHVATMLFHAATALPADHFFAFLMRFAYLGHLDDAMTGISLGHLLSALQPFTDERFGVVVKLALHPEDVALREGQLRIARPLIEQALTAREQAGQPLANRRT